MTSLFDPPAPERRCITCGRGGLPPGKLRHGECKPPTTIKCTSCREFVQIREFADHHLHRGGQSECEQIQALRREAIAS